MSKPTETFFELCDSVGKFIPWWTQGAGSNVSEKQGQQLWIKASGYRLDDVRKKNAFVELNLKEILSKFQLWKDTVSPSEEDYLQALKKACAQPLTNLSPSMETGFHAMLNSTWVIHFHSLVGILMCFEHRKQSSTFESWLIDKFPQKTFAMIPAQMPGLQLSLAIGRSPDFDYYLLENHGVIHQTNKKETLIDEWQAIESSFLQDFNYSLLLDFKFLSPEEVARKLLLYERQFPYLFYMPDAVVFFDRVRNILHSTSEKSDLLRKNAFEIDKDASEIAVSIALLHHICKHLPELPSQITGKVASLPTELLRRK